MHMHMPIPLSPQPTSVHTVTEQDTRIIMQIMHSVFHSVIQVHGHAQPISTSSLPTSKSPIHMARSPAAKALQQLRGLLMQGLEPLMLDLPFAVQLHARGPVSALLLLLLLHTCVASCLLPTATSLREGGHAAPATCMQCSRAAAGKTQGSCPDQA